MEQLKRPLTQIKMKKIFIVMMTLSLVFACKKDPEQNLDYCELHPQECVDMREVKNWFYFNYGSWWVYEEVNSGQRDSLYVLETFSDTNTYYFSTTLFDAQTEYRYRFWTEGLDSDEMMVKKSKKSVNIKRSKGKPGELVGENYCFTFYPLEGKYVGTYAFISGIRYFGDLTVEEFYDVYSLNDSTFNEVVKINEEYTSIENGQQTNHFYASGVGLIRKELIDSNQTWNLVKYNIEQ